MTDRQFEDHARIKEVARTVVKRRAADAISGMQYDVSRELDEQSDLQTMGTVGDETMMLMEPEVHWATTAIWERLAETTQRLKYAERHREP